MSNPEARAPNLYILGAAKSGTTSLYQYLSKHPDVYFPRNKEPQFYCSEDHFSRGQEYYLSTFYSGAEKYSVRADATPHYLYYEKVADRLRALPNADQLRFIVILREPVARAYSHYWNSVYEGEEKQSFVDALALEATRISDPELERRGTLTFHYASAGRYAKQLSAYLQRFPRRQFLILFQDDLKNEPEATLAQVYSFLGLKPIPWADGSVHNEAGLARSPTIQKFIRHPSWIRRFIGGWLPYSAKLAIAQLVLRLNKKTAKYPSLDTNVGEKLRAQFGDDIAELERLTGRDLGHWRTVREQQVEESVGGPTGIQVEKNTE